MEFIGHERFDDGHFCIGQNRPFQEQGCRIGIVRVHDIGYVAGHDDGAHDDVFTDAVDGRIGDLGEVFLKIVV